MSRKSNDIWPTGTCFDDALDLLQQLCVSLTRDEIVERYRVVHAICIAPTDEEYAHAWLEDVIEQTCLFDGIYEGERLHLEAPRDEYRTELRVKDVTEYTVWEALEHNLRTGHYGPWEPRYAAHCNKDGPPRVFHPVANNT